MFFRAMTPDVDGLPMRGRSARALGVRAPHDVSPHAPGYVNPGTGGLSVAPDSQWHVAHHRRPRGLGAAAGGAGPGPPFFRPPPHLWATRGGSLGATQSLPPCTR